MIPFRQLICEIIAERMTYADLMRSSDPKRSDRAKRIPARSLVVKSLNDREAWKFSYKTPKEENTTGLRHQGFIYFFKEGLEAGEDAMKIDCSVDCSCPDYKYRFSFANKQADAGENGPNSLNKGLNYPSSINAGPGLCKHLISLKEYLRTKIEGEPTEPAEPVQGEKPVAVPKSPAPGTVPPEEPEPVQPEVPQDPTQTPDPDKEKELQADPEQPEADPTQTPQEPEEEPKQSLEPEEPEEEPEKKLKESSDTMRISKILDDLCEKQRIFIV